jgi:acetyl esterase/lipase
LRTLLIFICFFSPASLFAQQFIPLWPEGKKPNSNGKPVKDSLYNERLWRVETPGLYAFPVARSENKGTTVLICPGGGYERISYVYNGFNLANWFNALGINVYVLIYRLPHQQDLVDRHIAPLQDAQRAMKYLKANSGQLMIDPAKIGVMGISAGGHLATTLATYKNDEARIGDGLDTISPLPAFSILLSPVISLSVHAHKGSVNNFLGSNSPSLLAEKYSTQNHVHSLTPPTFLVHAQDDSSVNVRNSLLYYQALLEKKIDATLHIFPNGGHNIKLTDNPGSTNLWLSLLELWMNEKGFVAPKKRS